MPSMHGRLGSARDGGYVVFASYARLSPQDTNHVRDVYVCDLATGLLTLESPGVRGTVANGESTSPGISGDGRYVVFVSSAGNLADPQLPPGMPRVFLRDREMETTRLLTTSTSGAPANGYSGNPAISADGTTIVFESAATDSVDQADAAGNTVGVYLVRRSSGERVRLNVSSVGEASAGQSVAPTVSDDGRYVAFMSTGGLDMCGAEVPPGAAGQEWRGRRLHPGHGDEHDDTCQPQPHRTRSQRPELRPGHERRWKVCRIRVGGFEPDA